MSDYRRPTVNPCVHLISTAVREQRLYGSQGIALKEEMKSQLLTAPLSGEEIFVAEAILEEYLKSAEALFSPPAPSNKKANKKSLSDDFGRASGWREGRHHYQREAPVAERQNRQEPDR